jgi:hypothetical protein
METVPGAGELDTGGRESEINPHWQICFDIVRPVDINSMQTEVRTFP